MKFTLNIDKMQSKCSIPPPPPRTNRALLRPNFPGAEFTLVLQILFFYFPSRENNASKADWFMVAADGSFTCQNSELILPVQSKIIYSVCRRRPAQSMERYAITTG